MNGDLKLTKNDIGCGISIKTNDGFFLEGQIKTVTDTNIEIKDLKTKNIFTIYIFEIKELEIIKNNGEKDRKFDQVCHNAPVIKKESIKYDHVVFGSLLHDERELNYCEVNEVDIENLLEKPVEEDVYVCRYLFMNAKDFRKKEEVYKKAIRYLSMFQTIGVSFYSNEDGVENKENCKIYKYLTLSVPHLDLVMDIDKLSGLEFRGSHERLVELLTSESIMKVVNVCQCIVRGVASALQVEMRNILDIQMMHYGLHNLRVASQFKSANSYSQLVSLFFNTQYKLSAGAAGGHKATLFFTQDDIVRKMAFNAHFLLPMFQRMNSRLLEPVRLISERICMLSDCNWDNQNDNRNDTMNDGAAARLMRDRHDQFNLENGSANNNNNNNNNNQTMLMIDYDMLPRSSQFWNYQDNSTALHARKMIDTEMQNEKQAVNLAGGVCRDVCEIKKSLAIAEEMTKKPTVNNYYEEVSDDDVDGDGDGEEALGDVSLSPNSKWNSYHKTSYHHQQQQHQQQQHQTGPAISRTRSEESRCCSTNNNSNCILPAAADKPIKQTTTTESPNNEHRKKLSFAVNEENEENDRNVPVGGGGLVVAGGGKIGMGRGRGRAGATGGAVTSSSGTWQHSANLSNTSPLIQHQQQQVGKMKSVGGGGGSSSSPMSGAGSVQSIELTRSEDYFLDEINNCSTSTRYPLQRSSDAAVANSNNIYNNNNNNNNSSTGGGGGLIESSLDPIDKIFAKGRGVASGNRRKISQSSGGGGAAAGSSGCVAMETVWRGPPANYNNNNTTDNHDTNTEEFCELSARHWNRNCGAAGGGGGGRSGKLRLDRLPDDDDSSSTVPSCNQAMGIMWNTFGMKSAQETDDLYAEFGL